MTFSSELINQVVSSGQSETSVDFTFENVPQQLINVLTYLKKTVTKDSYLNSYGSQTTQKQLENQYNTSVKTNF